MADSSSAIRSAGAVAARANVAVEPQTAGAGRESEICIRAALNHLERVG